MSSLRAVVVFVLLAVVAGDALAGLEAVGPLIEANLERLRGGASVVLVQQGRVVFLEHYGDFDAGTIVPIASASKWISASVILALVDEGKLSLDDRVSRYIPSFTGEKSAITIRQLFSHTSGLPSDTALNSTNCLSNRFTTLAACAEDIAHVPLVAQPGTEFRYGGASMQVGGRVAEIVDGRPWDQIFEQRIARPLGMVTMSYGFGNNPLIGGGVRSNLDDYLRFLTMIASRGVFEGQRVLSAAAIEQMQMDQTGGAAIVESPYARYAYIAPALAQTRYGLGEWLERVDASGRVVEINSLGAFGFAPWIDHERRLVGILMVQSQPAQTPPVYFELKKIVHEAIAPVPARRRAVRQ